MPVKKERVKDRPARVLKSISLQNHTSYCAHRTKRHEDPNQKDVTLHAAELTAGRPLTKKLFTQICSDFPSLNVMHD